MAGAPEGNQNRANAKRWSAAIERAVAAWPSPPDDTDCSDLVRGLNKAAHAFVAKMLAENDLGFFREFGDRLDGKAKQQIEASGPNGEALPVAVIERRVIGPQAGN